VQYLYEEVQEGDLLLLVTTDSHSPRLCRVGSDYTFPYKYVEGMTSVASDLPGKCIISRHYVFNFIYLDQPAPLKSGYLSFKITAPTNTSTLQNGGNFKMNANSLVEAVPTVCNIKALYKIYF
jgi:hypothetical protein